MDLEEGLYDTLLTERLLRVVRDLRLGDVEIEIDSVAEAELARLLSRHVGDAVAARSGKSTEVIAHG